MSHTHSDAVELIPRELGLYALYGDEGAWAELGLSPAFADQPLYVGKAERSLNGRDVGTHFAAGRTGSSTVRRSLVALLVDELALVAVPRNLAKPDARASFALDTASEGHLSGWMEQRLSLSTWPNGRARPSATRTAVVRQLQPLLNLDKVGAPRRVTSRGKRPADTARAWHPDDGPG